MEAESFIIKHTFIKRKAGKLICSVNICMYKRLKNGLGALLEATSIYFGIRLVCLTLVFSVSFHPTAVL